MLDALAGALLEHETLEQDEAYATAGIEPRRESSPRPTSDEWHAGRASRLKPGSVSRITLFAGPRIRGPYCSRGDTPAGGDGG